MEYRIEQDNDAENPRNWDNLTTLICLHNRYELGDKHDYKTENYQSWKELEDAINENENPIEIYRLFLYDHSGLRIKIGSFQGLLPQGHAEFDSGMVGFAIVTQKSVDEMGTPLDKIDEQVQGEIETYDDYLSGQVCGFVITDECKECQHEIIVDSCWGFYGSEGYKLAELEAQNTIKQESLAHTLPSELMGFGLLLPANI